MTLSPSKREIVQFVCSGDREAESFCEAFICWCHWIDDIVDKDRLWLPQETIEVNLQALLTFSANPFFERHKSSLLPLIIQAFRAFVDSTRMEKAPDVRDRRAADILKSNYHEVIWHVAFLVGGFDHMTAVTQRHRKFDYDCHE
jgi:hypothetical protein